MSRIRCVKFEQLPKTVADNINENGSPITALACEDIAYIPKRRKWLRAFSSHGFDDNREECGVTLSPLETVQTMERHLGFLAHNGLAIPQRMHYLTQMPEEKPKPILFSLVGHIEAPPRNWHDPAHKLKVTNMTAAISAYIRWIEESNEKYGLYDLARLDQAVHGYASGQSDEHTYLVDLDPLMAAPTHVNAEGHNVWELQKEDLSKLVEVT